MVTDLFTKRHLPGNAQKNAQVFMRWIWSGAWRRGSEHTWTALTFCDLSTQGEILRKRAWKIIVCQLMIKELEGIKFEEDVKQTSIIVFAWKTDHTFKFWQDNEFLRKKIEQDYYQNLVSLAKFEKLFSHISPVFVKVLHTLKDEYLLSKLFVVFSLKEVWLLKKGHFSQLLNPQYYHAHACTHNTHHPFSLI